MGDPPNLGPSEAVVPLAAHHTHPVARPTFSLAIHRPGATTASSRCQCCSMSGSRRPLRTYDCFQAPVNSNQGSAELPTDNIIRFGELLTDR